MKKAVGTQKHGNWMVIQRGRKCYGEPITYAVVNSLTGEFRRSYNDKATAERDATCLANCGL